MDAFDIIMYAIIALLVIFLVTFLYYIVLLVYRGHHDGYKVIYGWRMYDLTDQINKALEADSIYKGKRVAKSDKWMPYYSTLDDPVLSQVSKIVLGACPRRSVRSKMKFALRFVQLNIDYVTDSTQYGTVERYILPINTLMRRKGDCEDSSFLFQNLIQSLGYDVKCIRITGHITTGIRALGMPFTTTYIINDEKFKQAETTQVVPFAFCFGQKEVLFSATPEVPTQEFINQLTDE